jgi:signal transduction histidine kinase
LITINSESTMLVLAFPPRAPSSSSTSSDWWVPRGVSGRIWSALSRLIGWTGTTPRRPDDSRFHDVAIADRDDVALIAHDCLTLLAVMIRCADAMRHPDAEDDFLEFHRAVDRMDRLAQQLISPRQTETETTDSIDLNQLVVESEGMLKRAVAPGVSLRLQPGALGWVRVRARRWDFERILLHVVIRAARGMASGDVVLETSARAQARPSVTLIVTGSSTAPESRVRVDPRFSAARPHQADIGLAAVARLVQRMKGVLHFESDAERRTRIQVDFPSAADDAGDDVA